MAHLADLAIQNHLPRGLQRCHIAVGQVDHGDEAGFFRSIGHFRGLGIGFGQRLFAKHMLARRQKLQAGGW